VCGPPGSGKTTWVRDHAEAGDLIWDLDEVLGAFSYRGAVSPGRVSHWITTAAVLCRETLVDWLGSTTLDGEVGVYVIVTKKSEAERIVKTIGAELIELAARRDG